VLEHATTRPPLVDATAEQLDRLTTDLKTSGLLT
jgi:4-hydroxy-tetrahydrodipicolinate synthase